MQSLETFPHFALSGLINAAAALLKVGWYIAELHRPWLKDYVFLYEQAMNLLNFSKKMRIRQKTIWICSGSAIFHSLKLNKNVLIRATWWEDPRGRP